MGITLIMMCRERVDMLRTCFKTILETAHNPYCLETLIAIDDNDPVYMGIYKQLEKEYSKIGVRFIITKQSDNFTKDYWNPMAFLATNEIIMAIADDCEFMTKDWDKIIIEKFEKAFIESGDKFWSGILDDGIRNKGPIYKYEKTPDFNCWITQTKTYVNSMGYWVHPKIWGWSGDHVAYQIFKVLYEKTKWKRAIDITEVKIDQNDIHTGRMPHGIDGRYEKMCERDKKWTQKVTEDDIKFEAERLERFIMNAHINQEPFD